MRAEGRFLPAVWLCAALCVGGPAASGQAKIDPAEIAFQAAVKTETVDGDLKGAVARFQKLAAGTHRGIAAKALVRIGQCYEKMGDGQARAAYQRVVREFADQKETAAVAEARMAALDRPRTSDPVVVRRAWAAPDANDGGAPSPDGRSLVFVDKATGAIASRNLASGETRVLRKNVESGARPETRVLISPDGKSIAFTLIRSDGGPEIRSIGIDGGVERLLYRDERSSGAELGAWSPDGSRIVVAFTTKDAAGIEGHQVSVIAVRDGSVRMSKALGPRRPEPRGFSPDGKFIVCAYPPTENAITRDIFLLAAEGGGETTLVRHPADDQLLGWTPDGKGILFTSDRSAPRGVWFMPVADGKPQGAAELIKAGTGDIEPIGFSRSGVFFYTAESGRLDAYLAALDPAAGSPSAPPTAVDPQSPGPTQQPLFSPDGRSLAFFAAGPHEWRLRVRPPEGGELDFPVPHDLQVLRKTGWIGDRRAVLVSGSDVELRHLGFYLIDVRTGENEALLSSNPETEALGGEFSPDRKTLFITRGGEAFSDRFTRILKHDTATAEEREVYSAPAGADITNLALSPDGLELAFTVRTPNGTKSRDSLMVVPTSGGTAWGILLLEDGESAPREGLAWTPDGRDILLAKAVETSRYASRLELWRVSLRNREARRLEVLADDAPGNGGPVGLRVHPDGKSVAFQAARHRPEVWTMENFTPSARPPAFLNLPYEVTVEVWVNYSGSGQQTILAKGMYDYAGFSYGMNLTPEGKVQWGTRHTHSYFGESGDWSIDGIVTDVALRPNAWNHLACTLYGGKSASIYVNGSLSKTGAITQSILNRPSEPLTVGSLAYYGTPSFPFNGRIDEVAVYDRVLTAEEILERFLAGLPRHKDPNP